MRRILGVLGRIIVPILGQWRWTPPGWMGATYRGVTRGLSWWRTHRPAQLATLGLLLIVGIGLTLFFWPASPEDDGIVLLDVYLDVPVVRERGPDYRPDNLIVRFSGSAAKLEDAATEIDGDISLEPPIDGKWEWLDDQRLSFRPTEEWPIGQQFTVTIGEGLLPGHVAVAEDDYQFNSPSFTARLEKAEFYSDPKDPEAKAVLATVAFSHPVDRSSLRERVSFRFAENAQDIEEKGQPFEYEISYNEWGTEAYLRTKNVPIPMRDSWMGVQLDAGVHADSLGPGLKEPLSRAVSVPGMYSYFRIESMELSFARDAGGDPEQILIVQSKVPVHHKELSNNLKAWQLPRDKPEMEGEDRRPNYWWGDPSEIGPRILKLGSAVPLEHVAGEKAVDQTHIFRFKAQPRRHLYMKVKKGTKAWGGYVLSKTHDGVSLIADYPQELAILHEGSLLATSGDKKLSVLSRGIPGIKVELARVLPGELNHLITQTDGGFQDPRFEHYGFDEDDLAEIFVETHKLKTSNPAQARYTAVDFHPYIYARGAGYAHGLFLLRVHSWDPKHARTTGLRDRRLVLVTDMGIINKRDASDNNNVFIQSIRTGKPRAGVRVDVLGQNGLAVLSRTTDAGGLATFPDLSSYRAEKRPVAFVARSGSDVSYLPIGDWDRRVDFSRFDVDGTQTRGRDKKLDAYLFSDRGIYRPGDICRIGVIAKAANWEKSLDGMPLDVVISDPSGVRMHKERVSLNREGFIDTQFATEENSPTGTYTVDVYLVTELKDDRERTEFLGSTTVRIEEFLPDSMRIQTRFVGGGAGGWVRGDTLQAEVTLHNLYGTPAVGRRVTADLVFSARHLTFRGYGDYHFFDPAKAENTQVRTLDPVETNDQGVARFDIDLRDVDAATYSLRLMAEGFEADGGRSVSSEATVVVSPLDYVVGYKADGGLDTIERGVERVVKLMALNPELKKTAVEKLKAVIYQEKYISTLVRQRDGTYKYETVKKREVVLKNRLRIGAKGARYPLPTEEAGEFLLVLEGPEKKNVLELRYSVAGESNLQARRTKDATLQLKLDANDYSPGDEITLNMTLPYPGAGLITIEQDRVYTHKWFAATTTNAVATIKVPKSIRANAYVNVALTRRLDSPDVFTSPLAYAVKPFSINQAKQTEEIHLEVPELVRPGEELTIDYRTDGPAKIVVFAVDEGILQVADYSTPRPRSHFLAKRALEVTTHQILDRILPEQHVYKDRARVGGGVEEEDAIGSNLNPFKRKRSRPVAYWSGIIDSDSQQRRLSYTVPDHFNGTIRVMAVAVSDRRMGSGDRKNTARGPFVIHPSAPLLAAPGDVFQVSVAVANNHEGSGPDGQVSLGVEASDNLELLDGAERQMPIAEGKEGTTRFKVRARPPLGNAALTFVARQGDETASFETTLSVRPASPHLTRLHTGYLAQGTVSVPVERRLYTEFRKLEVSVSPLPLALVDGLRAYLDKFPHGCTEQLVSQAVPSLVLSGHGVFGGVEEDAREKVAKAVRILRGRQNEEGAFGYWAANSHVSNPLFVYAVQFLLEAKERGHAVPGQMLKSARRYLWTLAKADLISLEDARLRAHAIYVLARNGELATEQLAALREFLAARKSKSWHRGVIPNLLAATYVLMQDRREGDRLVELTDYGTKDAFSDRRYYDDLVVRGMGLYLISRHFPERLDRIGPGFMEPIVEGIEGGRFNTFSTSWLIYGIEAYASATMEQYTGNWSQQLKVEWQTTAKLTGPIEMGEGLIVRASFPPNASELRLTNGGDLNLYYQVTTSGFDSETQKDLTMKEGIEVLRSLTDPEGKPVDEVGLGDELLVHLKLRATGKKTLYDVAVIDLLPAGFEVVMQPPDAVAAYGRIGVAPSTFRPEYADVREDRVVLYGAVPNSIEEFIYRIQATTRGTFVVPPTLVESMYDRKIRGRTPSATITVVDPR